LLRLLRKRQRGSFSGVADRARVDREHLYLGGQDFRRPSFVAVMQPTDLGQRHDSPHLENVCEHKQPRSCTCHALSGPRFAARVLILSLTASHRPNAATSAAASTSL